MLFVDLVRFSTLLCCIAMLEMLTKRVVLGRLALFSSIVLELALSKSNMVSFIVQGRAVPNIKRKFSHTVTL